MSRDHTIEVNRLMMDIDTLSHYDQTAAVFEPLLLVEIKIRVRGGMS